MKKIFQSLLRRFFKKSKTPQNLALEGQSPRHHKTNIKAFQGLLQAQFETLSQHFQSSGQTKSLSEIPWYLLYSEEPVHPLNFFQGANDYLISLSPHLLIPQGAEAFELNTSASEQTWAPQISWHLFRDALYIEIIEPLFLLPTHKPCFHFEQLGLWIFKKRRLRPLNGFLLSLSLSSLKKLTAPALESANLLRQLLQQKISTLHKKLSSECCAYLLLSGLEALPGFNRYFVSLPILAQQQPYGLSFPACPSLPPAEVLSHFSLKFGQLIASTARHIFWQLGQQQDPLSNTKLYQFHSQLSLLKPAIALLISEIFSPLLGALTRGIFLTGHIQFKTAGLSLPHTSPRFELKTKKPESDHCFSAQLHEKIFRHEALLSTPHTGRLKKIKIYQNLKFSGILLLTLSLGLVWSFFFLRQLTLERSMAQLARQCQNPGQLQHTVLNHCQLHSLSSWVHGWKDWPFYFRPYPDKKSTQPLQNAYQTALLNSVLPQVLQQFSRALAKAARAPQNTPEKTLKAALSCYLMLQEVSHFSAQKFNFCLTAQGFKTPLGIPRAEFDVQLQDLGDLHIPPQTLDKTLIRSAQNALSHTPDYKIAYETLKKNATDNPSPEPLVIAGNDLSTVGAVFELSRASLRVPYFFTQAGRKSLYESQKSSYLKAAIDQDWILRLANTNDEPAFSKVASHHFQVNLAKMDLLYSQDYQEVWGAQLSALHIRFAHSLTEAIALLALAGSPDSPFLPLLKTLAKETCSTRWISFEWLWKPKNAQVPTHPIAQAFFRVNQFSHSTLFGKSDISEVLEHLRLLSGYLSDIAHSNNPKQSAYQAAVLLFQNTQAPEMRLLNQDIDRAPSPVKEWLLELRNNAYFAIFDAAYLDVQERWESEVGTFFQKKLQARFPLNPQATIDINATEFIRFFKPGGLVDQFVQNTLKPLIKRDAHGELAWQTLGELPFSTKMNLLSALTLIERIQQRFLNNPTQDHFSLTLKVSNMPGIKALELQYDGATYHYPSPKNELTTLSWPPVQDGSLTLKRIYWLSPSTTENYPGPWGLLHFLFDSTLSCPSNAANCSLHTTGKPSLTFELTLAPGTQTEIPEAFAELDALETPKRIIST